MLPQVPEHKKPQKTQVQIETFRLKKNPSEKDCLVLKCEQFFDRYWGLNTADLERNRGLAA